MNNLLQLDARRRQLGMSRAILARRAKLSVPTVQRILSGKEDSPSIATVEALAAALGMTLQFVEQVDANEFRKQQAEKRSSHLAGLLQGTMGLESQAVDEKTLANLTQRNIHRLLAGSNRSLWYE